MNWNRKAGLTAFLLAASLLAPCGPGRATAEGASEQSTDPAAIGYSLTDTITATVKSVLNEQTSGVTRIAVVVRLQNQGRQVARVPDDEVRVETDDGVEYLLGPSASNPSAIQPKETVELSYMLTLNREDSFILSALSWVQVDKYVYPKQETTILSIPISSMEWKGEHDDPGGSLQRVVWGEPFAIPSLSPSLQYMLAGRVTQTAERGSVAVMELLVENRSTREQVIPNFQLDGLAGQRVFEGTRVEQGELKLDPGEKSYLHYSIPIDAHVQLQSLDVLTPEQFVVDDQHTVTYRIGRLTLPVPAPGAAFDSMKLQPYDWNKPIVFDSLNKLIPADVSVSLNGLHLYKGDGFQAIVALFQMVNGGFGPLPIPNLQAELVNADGFRYRGTMQPVTAKGLISNLKSVIRYTFIVPDTEKGDRLAMELQEGGDDAGWRFPIAAFRTQIQTEPANSPLSFYPYEVNINRWAVQAGARSTSGDFQYTYKVTLNIEAKRQSDVVVDQSAPAMELELVDPQGEVVGRQSVLLDGKMPSGDVNVDIGANRYEYPLTIRVYEKTDTIYGEARRLVRTLQQN